MFSVRWGWMGLSVPSCLMAGGGGGGRQDVGRDPKASSCYARGTVPTPSEPPWGTQRCRCPLNHRHPLHPYGKKAGGAWGTGGPCLAWGLAHSQSNRWWSPPLPTGHAGKYLCPDFTGRREGISFLRPPAARLPGINPFTTPGEGGREVPCWCPPCGQWSGQGVQQGSIWCRWGTVGHSSGRAHGSAVAHCGPSTVYPGNPLLDIPCAGPVGYGEWANRASPLPRFPSTAPTGSPGCSWERDGGARRALFAHGCLLTICKCKTGPEGVEICACGGVGGAQGLLTASCWHPRLCPLFPSPFVPSWALSKRGCLLTPGLAALFVPLTFSSLYAGPFYGGFKGGSDPPLAPPTACKAHVGFPCPTALHQHPGGAYWGHLGGPRGQQLCHLPRPPPLPGTSGCPWHLLEWVRTAAPRSRIPGTLHPVSRGGKHSTGIRPAARLCVPPGQHIPAVPFPAGKQQAACWRCWKERFGVKGTLPCSGAHRHPAAILPRTSCPISPTSFLPYYEGYGALQNFSPAL